MAPYLWGLPFAKQIELTLIRSLLPVIYGSPTVALIDYSESKQSSFYLRKKKEFLNSIGYSFKDYTFPRNTYSKQTICELIQKLNNDSQTHGILVQLPLPELSHTDEIINFINPVKDIDGLCFENMEKLKNNDMSGLKSSAILSISHLLNSINLDFQKKIVLVGHGRLVNKPLNIYLRNKFHAKNIEIVDKSTFNGDEIIKTGDVIISATGVKHRITEDLVKKGAIIIDCGSKKNKEVDQDKILEKVQWITPIPGGVGALTISYLMINITKAYALQKNLYFCEDSLSFI